MPICDGYVHDFCYCLQLQQRSLPHLTLLLGGELCLGLAWFCSLELINYTSQARDTSPLTNTMDTEGIYPKNLEAFTLN